jgi:processive 1,2-diacylglycerol beta-glucosyltransferase
VPVVCCALMHSFELPRAFRERGVNSAGNTTRPPLRVLVFTAPVADGHVAAANALAEEIRDADPGVEVTVQDAWRSLGPVSRWFLRDLYRWQLRAAPWLFAGLHGSLRRSGLLRWVVASVLSRAASRPLLRLARRHPAHVVVSTWPPATMVLGRLRLRGKVRVPVCATITDFAGLELWTSQGVDLHLVMHESLVSRVERLAGRGSARAVAPLVSARFRAPRPAVEARRALALPEEATVVVVSGGGWGVGDLAGGVRAALTREDAFVVCLAGRERDTRIRLEREFANEPRVRVLGFTEAMSDLLAAADVLVHSTGGVTCLEALASGCPIVAYGAPPGHTPLLAREMDALGLVTHARCSSELAAALSRARTPAAVSAPNVSAGRLVLTVTPRVTVRLRARIAHAAATAAAVTALLFVLLASDVTYPVVAEALALPESSSLPTARDTVALIIRGAPSDLLAFAALARRDRLHASVAVSGPVSEADVAALRTGGLDPIPALQSGGVASWFEASEQLHGQTSRYGVHGRFYYLAPGEGFTIGDYLLARELDGRPLQAGCNLANWNGKPCSVHRGEVVVATLRPGVAADRMRLLAAIRRIEHAGIGTSSVQQLAARTAHSD